MEEKKELFETYGFDLKAIVDEAKEKGNEEFAKVVEDCIANVQACYDIIAQKHSVTAGEDLWNIDAEELRTRLK